MAAGWRKFSRVLGYAARQWRMLTVVVVLSLLVSSLAALQPWPVKFLVDHALGAEALPPSIGATFSGQGIEPGRMALVWVAALAGVAIFALHALLDAALTLAWSRAGQRMVYRLAGDLFLQLQRLSLTFHARFSVGDSLSRVTGDAWCVYTVTDSLLVAPARQLMVLGSVGVLAWQLDPGLTLLMMVGVPVLAASAWHFGALLQAAERRKREAGARLTSFVHQVLGAMPLVQAYAAAPRNRSVYDTLALESVQASRAGALMSHSFAIVNGVATTVGIALVVYAGGRQVLAQTMTLGSLLVFVAYVRSLDHATRGLLGTYGALRSAEASIDRVLEVLEAREMVADAPHATPLPERSPGRSGHLVFERVTVGYERERPVLREFSLEVRAGETVALVGATGAGKTTAASLVARFFDPWDGRVTLDGADLRDASLASLRGEIAMVLQDPFILPLTVAENIAYGRPDASREDIVAAAVAAEAHDFIRELPQGYDTVLGEQGADLSGGQRQRIAIARALLKNPRVLILDEPTAALDAATEALVMAALGRLMTGRTTLVIAHRLATVRSADRIAVLEAGRVVELGTHAELLTAGGRYARLYAASALGASAEGSR